MADVLLVRLGVSGAGVAGARHGPRPLRRPSRRARRLRPRRRRARAIHLARSASRDPTAELGQTFNSQPAIYVTSLACLAAARAAGALAETRRSSRATASASTRRWPPRARWSSRPGCDSSRSAAGSRRRPPTRPRAAWRRCWASTRAATEAVCAETGAELCNINSPGADRHRRREGRRRRRPARSHWSAARERAIPLDVGGAFHTSLMQAGRRGHDEGRCEARSIARAGDPGRRERHAASRRAIRRRSRNELVFQLTHPVRWVQCVEYMAAQGVEDVRRDRARPRAQRPDQAHRVRARDARTSTERRRSPHEATLRPHRQGGARHGRFPRHRPRDLAGAGRSRREAWPSTTRRTHGRRGRGRRAHRRRQRDRARPATSSDPAAAAALVEGDDHSLRAD